MQVRIAAAIAAVVLTTALPSAQVRLADDADRAAFRAWFVLLADAQFERQTSDVQDCAALVRHAVREALRAHTPEWLRRTALPFTPTFADVRSAPRAADQALPLFKINDAKQPAYAEFADAKTLIRFNTTSLGRDTRALRPGDLLYFRQMTQEQPDHLMVFVGKSHFDADGDDWVVYHTGQSGSQAVGQSGSQAVGPSGSQGEVRKVRLATLMQHPAPRWRPLSSNSNFVGVFRFNFL